MLQKEEDRLKERLHEMSDYQSYDFSFKVRCQFLLVMITDIELR